MDCPDIFNRDVFTMPSADILAQLSPERRARLDACSDQWAVLQSAEAEHANLGERRKMAGEQLQGFRQHLATFKRNFHDLWKETYGRG